MELQVAEAYVPLWQGGFEHAALYGGRGGGKSWGVVQALVGLSCVNYERIVCGRQFQTSIKDSVKELIEKQINAMNMGVYFKITDTEIYNVSTKSRFSFTGMDRNPDSAKSLEGCSIFWGEEAQSFTTRAVEIIIPTVRAPGSRMIWTWNPRYRTDEIDKMFRSGTPPENSYIKPVSYADNPYFYQTRMPSEMRRSLRANPKRHTHIWLGGYDENPDAAIFTDWEVGRVEIPDKAIPLLGADFGFSDDPNVLIKAYFLPDVDTIYVAEESYGYKIPNRNIPDLFDKVTECRDYEIVADSARPETIEYLQSCGFNMRAARKGPGSIKNGINWLCGYKIVISPDCPIFKEEVSAYCWLLDAAGKPLPVPAPRQQDHGIDALRYAVEDHATNEAGDNDVLYI